MAQLQITPHVRAGRPHPDEEDKIELLYHQLGSIFGTSILKLYDPAATVSFIRRLGSAGLLELKMRDITDLFAMAGATGPRARDIKLAPRSGMKAEALASFKFTAPTARLEWHKPEMGELAPAGALP
jgi:hypothetical protein